MSTGAHVAMFTSYTKLRRLEIQLAIRHSVGRVAPETGQALGQTQFPAHGFLHGMRHNPLFAHGDLEARNARVITYEAVVQMALIFQHPGLSPGSESPADWHGDSA